jgi:hypothetical protein
MEPPENSAERSTFPGRSGMTPDFEVMAWRLGGVADQNRLRMIALMKDGKTRSPKDLAQALELPLGVASYHVRFAVERDILTLHHTEPKRGALQHFYVLSAHGMDLAKVLRL